jgi:hypothetical protein
LWDPRGIIVSISYYSTIHAEKFKLAGIDGRGKRGGEIAQPKNAMQIVAGRFPRLRSGQAWLANRSQNTVDRKQEKKLKIMVRVLLKVGKV